MISVKDLEHNVYKARHLVEVHRLVHELKNNFCRLYKVEHVNNVKPGTEPIDPTSGNHITDD